MVIKLLTPEINPKKSMVASSDVGFEVHSEMNTFTNNMGQEVLESDNKDIQEKTIFVYYVAQSDSESENETDEKENDEKYELIKESEPELVRENREIEQNKNNLIEKLADLKISINTDDEEKTESSSATEEPKIKNEKSNVAKEIKQNDSSLEETVQPITSKKDENSQNKEYGDEKKQNNNFNKVNEKDSQKEHPKVKMNIQVDEVVAGIDNLKLTKTQEENDDDSISRGPVKDHQNIGNHRTYTQPYSIFKSHSLQTGGCIVAQVSATQTYNIQPPTFKQQESNDIPIIERSISPLLNENHYLSDEAEKFIWDLLLGPSEEAKREKTECRHQTVSEQVPCYANPVNTEQQVPYANHINTEITVGLNNVFPSSENQLCPSPSLSEDLSMFSPPPCQYRQYSIPLSTGTPSPMSLSTDSSSVCYSPPSSISPDSLVEDTSEKVFSLNVSSLPSTSTDIQYNFTCPPANNLTENIVWQNKPMTLICQATNVQPQTVTMENKRITNNINDVVIRPQHNTSCTSLNLPTIRQEPEVPSTESQNSVDRMRLSQEKNRKAFHDLALISDADLSASDKDGDTKLLIMIAHKLPKGLEYLYALVRRLMKIPGALAARNSQNHSALLLACMYMPNQPLVARFIAESLQNINHDLNEVYENGNTIIHWLAERGDAYLNVLVELLSMQETAGHPCFDINRHNHSTGTPLLVAVKAHGQVNCSRTIAFLLSQGANVTETERCGGRTPLHIAIKESGDPLIVQILLKAADRQGKNLVNCMDYPRDTALHYAHLRNDLPVQQQLKIITLLLQYGANNVTGSQGRMPLALVMPAERKEFIRANTQRRNRKP